MLQGEILVFCLTFVLRRASLHEPGLDTDPGQFSVEYYVYMSPGWVRVGSFSADPGQFPFRWVERAGDYLSVSKMADEPCNHHNHQFALTLSAILVQAAHGRERRGDSTRGKKQPGLV